MAARKPHPCELGGVADDFLDSFRPTFGGRGADELCQATEILVWNDSLQQTGSLLRCFSLRDTGHELTQDSDRHCGIEETGQHASTQAKANALRSTFIG